jgi:dipeptidyl aminopeptidase/acylaminoacyl peptidase
MRKLSLLFALIVFCVPALAQNYTIQQYLNIKSAGSPTLSPDGKKLAYLTNDSGLTQIWMVDLAENKPRQITSYDDNIGFVRWSPAGNGLLFGKARGGDENTQFFWMASSGIEIRELTKDPKVRHNFGGWSEDGKKIYYSSNKRNPTFFDIYSMDVVTGKEELLYQFDGNNDFAAINDSGSKLIVSRDGIELSLDNNLYLVDLRTKQEILLTPHEGSAQFGDVHFTADGIVYAQNDKREFYSLSNLRLKNAADKNDWSDANRVVKVLDETPWDLGAIAMNAYPSRYAYTLNREGFSDLYIGKVETDGKPLITVVDTKTEKVTLPGQGIVGGLTFSNDESKLAFTFSSAKYNTDIWLYDLATKKLTQVTKSDRAGIAQESFIEPQLIKYKSFDGREITAWYYKPKNFGWPQRGEYNFSDKSKFDKEDKSKETANKTPDTPGKTAVSGPTSILYVNHGGPVIVSVHGGPEGQERPGFSGLYQYYLSRGYAVLATNVRGSTGYGKTFTHLDDVKNREDSVKDLAYAVEWLKKDGGADPKRIAVMGGSYGGYMTLAAITLYPDLWAAAVDTVGIANWESFLKNTSGYRRRQREVEYGRLDKDIDFLRAISPLAKVNKIKCPLFVIQGKNDPRVPYTEAQQIVKAVKDRGGIVEYKLYDDEGHGIAKLKNRLDLYPLVADFLDKYMK